MSYFIFNVNGPNSAAAAAAVGLLDTLIKHIILGKVQIKQNHTTYLATLFLKLTSLKIKQQQRSYVFT